ncbi:hypothetical protein [Bacteriovorax sp. Seq25_V]|uniref:hypothetical protein n=1 Tax=Bacteriovorax sp. Seq25_V TaxID=1201288 RepID=UPI00038A2CC5|nr:hypothetical protein [Bacteriovorax sp. Seq25_V]EQC45483.1 hypothetical protein M900_1899 [Bacteriovorax sp. Seq25_V]
MSNILDNKEVEEVMTILENLDDEVLAVELLKKFNEASKNLGMLVVNKDPRIPHDEWKVLCDEAQKELDDIVLSIKNL